MLSELRSTTQQLNATTVFCAHDMELNDGALEMSVPVDVPLPAYVSEEDFEGVEAELGKRTASEYVSYTDNG